MKTLTEHLSQYALYHRDQRNITTHYAGIPLIVVAIFSLLSLPLVSLAGIMLTPALLLFIATAIFYFRLDFRFGLVMLLFSGSCFAIATYLAAQPFAIWLGSSLGLFVVGWVLQFIGHYYEGKKPAFVDDIVGLFVGPLFVVAEIGFSFGLRKALQQEIEKTAGKVH
ncbi:Uncharacterized membrane protein YGL010W [Arsukibacterium tuosuense]|uniref:Uncharacterized membrane protein YGL010W n=1 Tax=Arsukibacterium tuosuense TaxID=1323745 RepID=A0A285INV8_9GAMM|nr:Mpo1-like protein [Arsukibacterium tuosuense]SNY49634.1 Uncharacterized membrane protein YGL010W [Arsukibacterium tuosuense]